MTAAAVAQTTASDMRAKWPAVAAIFDAKSIPVRIPTVEGVRVMREHGMSWREMGQALGLAHSVVHRFAAKHDLLHVLKKNMEPTSIELLLEDHGQRLALAKDSVAGDLDVTYQMSNQFPGKPIGEIFMEPLGHLPRIYSDIANAVVAKGVKIDTYLDILTTTYMRCVLGKCGDYHVFKDLGLHVVMIDIDDFGRLDSRYFIYLAKSYIGVTYGNDKTQAAAALNRIYGADLAPIVDLVLETAYDVVCEKEDPETLSPKGEKVLLGDGLSDADIAQIDDAVAPIDWSKLSDASKPAVITQREVGRDWDRIRSELTSMPPPPVEWDDLDPTEQRILQGFADSRMVWMTVLDEDAVEVLLLLDLVKRPEHEPSNLIGLTDTGKALVAPRMSPFKSAVPQPAWRTVAEAMQQPRIERSRPQASRLPLYVSLTAIFAAMAIVLAILIGLAG